eukprot:gene10980-3052_t
MHKETKKQLVETETKFNEQLQSASHEILEAVHARDRTENELNTTKIKYRTLYNSVLRLKQESSQLSDKVQGIKAVYLEKISDLSNLISSLKQCFQGKQDLYKQMTKNHEMSCSKLKQTTIQFHRKEAELEELRESSLKKDRQLTHMQSLVAKLKQQVSRLKEQSSQTEEQVAKLNNLQKAHEQLKGEFLEVQQSCLAQRQHIEKLEAKKTDLDKFAQLQRKSRREGRKFKELMAAANCKEYLQRQNEDLQQHIERLQRELDTVNSRETSATNVLSDLEDAKAKIETLKGEVNRAKESLREKSREIKKMKLEYNSTKACDEQLKDNLYVLNVAETESDAPGQVGKTANYELKEKNKRLKEEVERLKQKCKRLEQPEHDLGTPIALSDAAHDRTSCSDAVADHFHSKQITSTPWGRTSSTAGCNYSSDISKNKFLFPTTDVPNSGSTSPGNVQKQSDLKGDCRYPNKRTGDGKPSDTQTKVAGLLQPRKPLATRNTVLNNPREEEGTPSLNNSKPLRLAQSIKSVTFNEDNCPKRPNENKTNTLSLDDSIISPSRELYEQAKAHIL